MERDYNAALDFVLKWMRDNKNEVNDPRVIGNKIREDLKHKFDFEDWESNAVTNDLVDKGYHRGYKLTLKGLTFINSGGYEQQLKNDKIELRYKKLGNFSLIFGGVAAGVYYTVELLQMLWSVSLPFCFCLATT